MSISFKSPKTVKSLESLWRLEKIILNSLDFSHVVQEVVDTVLVELGYLNLGYEIVVLNLIDENEKILQRISISKTKKANEALKKSPIPFHQIKIPLNSKDNLLIKSINNNHPYFTIDWSKILSPAFLPEDARSLQKDLNIEASLVVPVVSQKTPLGSLIFSMSKHPKKVTRGEKELIYNFADIVGLAVQNASLFSQVENTNQDLKQANRQLRHLNKLKDEFVFISTHELKTPVTVLKGYMAMINDGNYGQVNDKLQEPLKEMQGATGQLVQLVNDLLEIARSEAKTLQIQTAPIEICSVIDNSLEGLRTLAQQKGLELNHDCRPKQIYAMADPDRIREILNNLVSNAIKYSDTGTITIDHVIEGNHVITHVKDQGVGIDEKDQTKVFTRFFRADEQASKVPGTGLGLFIVKQIVEKMGGKIWFQSKLGKGTTFSFSLPKANPPSSN